MEQMVICLTKLENVVWSDAEFLNLFVLRKCHDVDMS